MTISCSNFELFCFESVIQQGNHLMKSELTPSANRVRRHCRNLVVCAVMISTALVGCTQPEPETASPKSRGETITDRYVEVTGGFEVYAKIQNRVTEGLITLPAQGLEMNLTIYAAKPNKTYLIIKSPAVGTIESGTNDGEAWSNSLMAGPVLRTGNEKLTTLRDATFDRLVHWRQVYNQAEYVGSSDVAGTACDEIRMVPVQGPPQTFHYEQESGLLAKIDAIMVSDAGELRIESYFSEYKRVDGILIPHKVRIIAMGQERVFTTKSCKHNVDLPSDRFEPPADVRALITTNDG